MKLLNWRKQKAVGQLRLLPSYTLWSYLRPLSSLRKPWPSLWHIAGEGARLSSSQSELNATRSDTRVLLCSTETGQAFPMTEDHHADTLTESNRLRKLGTGLVTDSFGEARYILISLIPEYCGIIYLYLHRWMGAVANTRG